MGVALPCVCRAELDCQYRAWDNVAAMKYYVEVDGQSIAPDFLEDGEQVVVQVGEQRLPLDLQLASQPSLYSLLIDNRSYEVLVEARGEDYDVLIGSEMFHLKVQDEWARRLANIQRK